MSQHLSVSRGRFRVAMAAALALTLTLFATPAMADKRDELEQQREQNKEERKEVAAALEGTNSKLADVYLQLDDIERRLPIAQGELGLANEALAAAARHAESVQNRLNIAQAQQEDLNAEIQSTESEIDENEGAMGEVARSAYRGGANTSSALTVVLQAESVEEFANQYSVMNSALRTQNQALTTLEDLIAVNRNRQARLTAVEERIGELKAEADAAVTEADAARTKAANLVTEIEDLQVKKKARAAKLKDLRNEYKDQIANIQADNESLSAEIAEIDRKERERRAREQRQREAEERAAQQRAQQQSSRSDSSGGSSGSSVGASSASRSLIPPVPSPLVVTSGYGLRWYPITGGYFKHEGVDLSSACGNSQVAAASGTVYAVRPAPNGTHGNQVMINHGTINGSSYVTVYNHLSQFAVSQGQSVSQGQTIGYTGATGLVTGCHVHFEVWKNGATIDPMSLPGF